MGKVRLVDIAKNVGVSVVTVHNALTGNKGVSEELRDMIYKEAESMGYQPSSTSKKIEDNKSDYKKIGVIIAENYLSQDATYYWKMYQELTIVASEKGCFTIIEVLKKEEETKTLLLPKIVAEQSIEGLIVIGEIDKRYIRKLKEVIRVPMVFLDFYDKDLAKDAVVTDGFYGMYLLTELLFENGFKNIGFIGSIYATSSIMDRYCGYMKSMLEHRIPIHQEWVLEDRDKLGQVEFDIPEKLPEAFVCNCDLVAGMLILKLKEKGYRVPEDISIVGYDNYLYPAFTDIKITTYEVNTKVMTKVALDKVLKQIKNPKTGRGMDIVSGHMVIKQSVKLK